MSDWNPVAVGKHQLIFTSTGDVEIDYDPYYHGIVVHKNDRAAVALALLGKTREELIERADVALLELVRDTKWDYLFDVEADRRESLRTLLAAIFGDAAHD